MKTAIIALVVAVAIVTALALTQFVIPTASYERLIAQAVAEKLGATATIGKMRVRVLPRPSFTISDITIASPEPEFQHAPIARISSIEGTFSLISILKNHLTTDLTIRGYEINELATTSDGTNLDRVFAMLGASTSGGVLAAWDFRIDKITAYRGVVARQDASSTLSSRTTISKLILSRLKGGGGVSGNVYIKAALFGSQRSNVELSGRFSFDRRSGTLHLRGGRASLAGASATIDATCGVARKPMSFELHAASPAVDLPLLASVFTPLTQELPAGTAIAGPMALDLYVKGSRERAVIRLQAELTRTNVTIGKLFIKPTGRLMKVGFAGTESPSHLTIEALNLRMGDNFIQITGSVLHQPDHQAQLTITAQGLKLTDVAPSLPVLGIFERADNLGAKINVQGSLDVPTDRLVFGTVTAATANILGSDLTGLSVDFHQRGESITLPRIGAHMLGGSLSANGSIAIEGTPRYSIQAVLGGMDMDAVPQLSGAIKGKGDLVTTLQSSGSDAASMAANKTIAGTLVMSAANLPTLALEKDLMGNETWRMVSAQHEGFTVDAEAKAKLPPLGHEATNLQATFTKAGNVITVDDMRYLNPAYTLWMRGEIRKEDYIDTTGSIWLNRTLVESLITDAKVRNALTNKLGALQIPFTLKGRGDGPIVRLETNAFKNVVEVGSAPTPMVKGAPLVEVKEEKKTEEKETVKKSVKQEPAKEQAVKKTAAPKKTPAKTTPTERKSAPRKKRSPSRGTQMSPDEADDIMKVLIR